MSVKKNCLSCKYYRIEDASRGLCRLALKAGLDAEAGVKPADHCEKWVDCGQTYYIRTGWLKQQAEKGGGTGDGAAG